MIARVPPVGSPSLTPPAPAVLGGAPPKRRAPPSITRRRVLEVALHPATLLVVLLLECLAASAPERTLGIGVVPNGPAAHPRIAAAAPEREAAEPARDDD